MCRRVSVGLWLSLLGVGGVAIGVVSDVQWAAGLALAIGAAACAPAAAWAGRRCGHWCLWSAVCALALAYGAHARDLALAPKPAWAAGQNNPVFIEGRLRRDASRGESGVRLELDEVRVLGGRAAVVADSRLTVLAVVGGELSPGLQAAWTAGRRVTMPAQLRIPAVVRNPGSPSVRWQHLTRPFDVVGTVKSGLLVTAERGAMWQEAAASVRRYVRAVSSRWLAPLGAQSSAVMTAVLIGDRAGLDSAVMRRLQVAGTFHVIAISGGNVAILTALCLFLFRTLIRHDQVPVLATLMIVVAYGLIVGRDASVMRAVVAATLYLSLRLLGIVPHPLNVLALTALICVGIDPFVVLDVGAWLSFGATFGLIAVLPRLIDDGGARVRRNLWRTLWRAARGLFLATVAAEIAILPVVASVFMRVGVAGLVLNFVAIPAMALIQVAGLVLCGLSPLGQWWDGPAALVAMVAHVATSALLGSAGLVDIAPWLVRRVPSPPLGWTTMYYAAVMFALTWRGRRIGRRGAVVAAALSACAIVAAPWIALRRPPAGWVRLTVIDVGQGDSIAVQLPGGHDLLVDAGGSAGTFDVGGRVVTPALWASGIRQLDWLAVTHGDVDHAGGALRVVEDLRPGEIWEGVPVPGDPLLSGLRRAAHASGIAWRRLQSGDQLELGGVLIDVLHPPPPDWERPKVRNDDSVVLRLRYGVVELLLTGDAGPEFESAFTPGALPPPIRILKAGHHGSRTSSSEQFLNGYGPAVALVSAGQGNLFGHPSPIVIDRLLQRGVDVFRTDRDGAIVIETDGREARVRTATGRSLTVRIGHASAATPSRVSPAATRPPFPP